MIEEQICANLSLISLNLREKILHTLLHCRIWQITSSFVYLPQIMKRKEGNPWFPSSFFRIMSTDNNLETIKKLLLPLLEDDIFLVDMKVKPTNNFKIFLDADSGLGIEKCIKINRALYKQIEALELYPEGEFSLEVSSPGIEEPLKMHRQYVKNTGRSVEVIMNDDSKREGKLLEVNEDNIVLEFTEGKGKKAVTQQLPVAFSDIKQTIVQIKF